MHSCKLFFVLFGRAFSHKNDNVNAHCIAQCTQIMEGATVTTGLKMKDWLKKIILNFPIHENIEKPLFSKIQLID